MPLDLRQFIRLVPDFPKPGIVFRDITPLLANPGALDQAVAQLAQPYRQSDIEVVVEVDVVLVVFIVV